MERPKEIRDVISRQKLFAAGAVCLAGMALAACGSSSSSSTSGGTGSFPGGTINGSGSTFVQPLVEQWASNLKDQGLTVNYQGIGSGGGQAALISGTVDFAGSDPPFEASQLKQLADKNGTDAQMVPVAFGAVTLSYNVPGVETGLKLDGATIADIYLGNITKWNDAAIADLNPDVKLPDTPITVVHRSDDSGTTKLFTTFLADYSKTWESQVGADSTVKWPVGTGANGNDGVAGQVKQTEGAIGYVELAYALQSDFTTADVQNSEGNFVAPTTASSQAAAASVKAPPDLGVETINAPGADSYPVASATHIVVYKDMCKAGLSETDAQNVVGFLDYALGDGQDVATQLDYATVPSSLLDADKQAVAGLECNGKPISG
jgi:phosphate transport system substrate-binding protein